MAAKPIFHTLHIDTMRKLIEKSNIEEKDNNGCTALQIAIREKNEKLFKLLLEAKASIRTSD